METISANFSPELSNKENNQEFNSLKKFSRNSSFDFTESILNVNVQRNCIYQKCNKYNHIG